MGLLRPVLEQCAPDPGATRTREDATGPGVAHTGLVHTSSDEEFESLPKRVAFRPPLRTTLRENFSVVGVGTKLLPRRRPNVPINLERVPVLLVPGFLSGDFALTPMSEALRARGHWTSGSGITPNVGCTRELADAVQRRAEEIAEQRNSRVAIVGWSRGGTLGKIVALERPDLIASLITLGTPNLDPLAINVTLSRQLSVLTRLHALGVKNVISEDCLEGECARAIRTRLAEDFPTGVGYTSIFSMSDGVIDWRACLDPDAVHVEVDATHMAMGADVTVMDLVVQLLADVPAVA